MKGKRREISFKRLGCRARAHPGLSWSGPLVGCPELEVPHSSAIKSDLLGRVNPHDGGPRQEAGGEPLASGTRVQGSRSPRGPLRRSVGQMSGAGSPPSLSVIKSGHLGGAIIWRFSKGAGKQRTVSSRDSGAGLALTPGLLGRPTSCFLAGRFFAIVRRQIRPLGQGQLLVP